MYNEAEKMEHFWVPFRRGAEMKIPKHLGVIMDGNRRYAQKLGLPKIQGHTYGVKTFHKILDWLKDLGVKEVTFYTLSTENLKRSKAEVKVLFEHLRRELKKFRHDERIKRDKIRVRFYGRLHLLPEDLQQLMHELMEATKKHTKHYVNFAVAYGGRAELVDAVSDLVDEASTGTLGASEITEEIISLRLWMKNDMDMVIRTGGAKRTSNFFPWQTIYAEWFFLKKFFPELTKADFSKCFAEFEKRERRFGK